MQIATWNINGVKARIDGLTRWLEEASPDVVCLQEIKSVDEAFPAAEIERLGYNVATHGQKGFNGVALLSKRPMEDIRRGLPGDEEDAQSRWIEAVIPTDDGGIVRVASLYLPNGNPVGTDKYAYKLAWMARLHAHAARLAAAEEAIVLAGDYNVIPEPADARFPERWVDDALFQPESRARFHALANAGWRDALRSTTDAGGHFTFWDYQAGAWQRDNGIRIDHVMLSPQAADRFRAIRIDRHVRAWDKPSDHIPVVATLAG